MSSAADLTSRVLRHERALVGASAAILAAFAWWYLVTAAPMAPLAPAAAMRAPPFGGLVVMWCLMMVAMMLPSAAPAVLLYSRVRQMRQPDPSVAHSWVFLSGYLAIWFGFSVLAAILQTLLTGPSMALGNRFAQAALLFLAGIYQLSPLKSACVRQCRSPAEFLSRHWQPGWSGAVRLGLRHGIYCLGCCWMLMALLFVGGVMNLLWIVALTLIVASEKLLPRGEAIARVSGVALILAAAARLFV